MKKLKYKKKDLVLVRSYSGIGLGYITDVDKKSLYQYKIMYMHYDELIHVWKGAHRVVSKAV